MAFECTKHGYDSDACCGTCAIASMTILRAALHEAKNGCTRACTDNKIATKTWEANICLCSAVQHNAKIDAAIKAAKDAS